MKSTKKILEIIHIEFDKYVNVPNIISQLGIYTTISGKKEFIDNVEKEIEKSQFNCTEEYLKWIKGSGLSDLTNSQARFAEWLLEEENSKMLSQIGNYGEIFDSIYNHLNKNIR